MCLGKTNRELEAFLKKVQKQVDRQYTLLCNRRHHEQHHARRHTRTLK
jgi:hypothetical protein